MFSRRNNRCYDMSNNMMWKDNMMDKKMKSKDESYNNLQMENQMCCDPMPGCKMQPVYECPVEKCVHRTICHEVPQE